MQKGLIAVFFAIISVPATAYAGAEDVFIQADVAKYPSEIIAYITLKVAIENPDYLKE